MLSSSVKMSKNVLSKKKKDIKVCCCRRLVIMYQFLHYKQNDIRLRLFQDHRSLWSTADTDLWEYSIITHKTQIIMTLLNDSSQMWIVCEPKLVCQWEWIILIHIFRLWQSIARTKSKTTIFWCSFNLPYHRVKQQRQIRSTNDEKRPKNKSIELK